MASKVERLKEEFLFLCESKAKVTSGKKYSNETNNDENEMQCYESRIIIAALHFNTSTTLFVPRQDGGGQCYYDTVNYFSSVVYSFITVEDVPDLDPLFISVPYVGSVEENSPLVSADTFLLHNWTDVNVQRVFRKKTMDNTYVIRCISFSCCTFSHFFVLYLL